VDSHLALYGGLFTFTCSEDENPKEIIIYQVANLYLYDDAESRDLPSKTEPVLKDDSRITVNRSTP
jgi:hypothetical protein